MKYVHTHKRKLFNSLDKTLRQLAVVGRYDLNVTGERVYPVVDSLILSETFWRSYRCHHCGAGCRSHSKSYLPDEYDTLKKMYPVIAAEAQFEEEVITINGVSKIIYTDYMKDTQEAHRYTWCRFLDMQTALCTIHNAHPWTCQTELIKIKNIKGRGYIGKQSYGRKWEMPRVTDGERGALCSFHKFKPDQFYNNDIQVFERMKVWADYWGIDTWLPEVISTMKDCVKWKAFGKIIIHEDHIA